MSLPSLAEISLVRYLPAGNKTVTPSSRKPDREIRRHSRRGERMKSKKSADVTRREKAFRQSLVTTNDLAALSSFAFSALAFYHPSMD